MMLCLVTIFIVVHMTVLFVSKISLLSYPVWEDDSRSHSREDHNPKRQELQVTCQDAAALDVSHIFGGQSSLNNNLKNKATTKKTITY